MHYWPIDPYQQPVQELKTPEMQRLHQTVVQVLPQLSALLSPEAEIELDLTFGELLQPAEGLWVYTYPHIQEVLHSSPSRTSTSRAFPGPILEF